VCAFARIQGADSALALAPRLLAVGRLGDPPLGSQAWGDDTRVSVPPEVGVHFRNVFTDEGLEVEAGQLALARIFASFPVALLVREA
jgi:maltooligosyltrehalose synthase